MRRSGAVLALSAAVVVVMPALSVPGAQASAPAFRPGAAGVGDPYYPLDGNGGYDVQHYDLDVAYDPPTDKLTGTATIQAEATQNLSRFDLDLVGLTVRSITVAGKAARWRRDGQELVVTPARGLRRGARYAVRVRYDGVPATLDDDQVGRSGFIHQDDGEIVAGEPHVASSWFPVNDHPSDKASYTFHVTVPNGLDVIANGELKGKQKRGPVTRWTWGEKAPMASYLATVNSGRFDVTSSHQGGISYLDAVHEDLFKPFAVPRTGSRYAYSQQADVSYKRLARTIAVPAGGADLSFQVAYGTQPGYDHVFVEAHHPGRDDWTTLPDANGHTSADPGDVCTSDYYDDSSFVTHYLTLPPSPGEPCTSSGTTGQWWAASGASDGYENWDVDLSAYAGGPVEVSITYLSDGGIQRQGVFVDDVVVSTGEGSTSFEDDGDTYDGWTVAGPPEGTSRNENDWIIGPANSGGTSGVPAQESLDRLPEVLAFLSTRFGPYPFPTAGGLVHSDESLGFALETQTRPIYSTSSFLSGPNTAVITHESAHQWFGDSLSVRRWQDLWLNEGFATYAQWLWDEHRGYASVQEEYDYYAEIPADDEFWSHPTADPGVENLLGPAVYDRGALALHTLRLAVGDATFFRILRTWTATHRYGNVSTAQFTALAEKLAGRDLDDLFDAWLFTGGKPAGFEPPESAEPLSKGEWKHRIGVPVAIGAGPGEAWRDPGAVAARGIRSRSAASPEVS
jgi:Peptidase family M1 domain/Peptidase M1 N-terminal domain/Immune inhibitor A peptidase M6